MDELYIWVVRWGDFQHYAPERDRAPAWIKFYPKQLDDDRYTDLPPRARGLLSDLRAAFARTSGNLRADTKTLSKRTCMKVFSSDVERLNHAGFIELVSRAVLEQRLESFYTSRAPAPSKEGEVEETTTVEAKASTALALVSGDVPDSRSLVAGFVDEARSRRVEVPRRVIGQVAQSVKQLLDEGIEPERVRAGLVRMLDRGRVIPSSLPNFVMEAGLPSQNGKRYGRGNSAARIIAETRGLA